MVREAIEWKADGWKVGSGRLYRWSMHVEFQDGRATM